MSRLPKSAFEMLPLSRLHESPANPRRVFDEAKLLELAESLRVQGLIQPIVARPNADGFEIVAGARRFRAAQLAKLAEIPTRVVTLTAEQALEWPLIENSQRVDVHPYEEAQGFQRLLGLPGYDVVALSEKTGKSESLVYARLALLQLIPEIAEAFQRERITASHATLLARLPQDHQRDAFEKCWRKDWQDTEPHLLPAKYLAAWIANNVYLPLDQAPFDHEDSSLNPDAGACSSCPRRSGFNTSLFSDVSGDQCMDSDCYHVKLSEHVQREISAKPELVQIETAFRNTKDRQPGTLSRNEYTDLDALKKEGEDAEAVTPCDASKTAIVVYGEGAGTTRTVCTDPNCPVHHPRRVVPPDPEAEARQREFEREQAQRKRLLKRRTESFNRILDSAPAAFTGPQLRIFLRALINIDAYDFADDVAAHFVGDDENNQQSAEEVLLSVMDGMEDDMLPALALRLALTGHIDIPREGEASLKRLSEGIDEASRRFEKDGKAHNFTMSLRSAPATGVIVHCNQDPIEEAWRSLQSHCENRKYLHRAEEWYGICIEPRTKKLRIGIGLEFKWEHDEAMERRTRAIQNEEVRRVGRNDPCPCGSGKKYKRFHGH